MNNAESEMHPTIKKSLTVATDPAADIGSVLRWEEERMGAVSRGVLKQALANVEALQDDLEAHRFMADAAISQWKIRDAEIEVLRAHEARYAEAQQRIADLQSELAEARKDAERYRWLRDQPWVEPEATARLNLPEDAWLNQYHDALDAAIDAARK